MVDTLRIKRRAAGGAAGAPASLAAAELAFNEQDQTLYYGAGNSGGNATSIYSIGGPGAFLPLAGGTLSGGLTISSLNTATVGQLYLRAPGGALFQTSSLHFGGTFHDGTTDYNNRFTASLRSGFSSAAWGNEYLDVWVNSTVNDAASEANQAQIARFANAGITAYKTLTTNNGLTANNSAIQCNAGLTFNSYVSSSPQNLAYGINFYNGTFGFNITGAQFNYNVDSNSSHIFWKGATQYLSIGASNIITASVPTTFSGTATFNSTSQFNNTTSFSAPQNVAPVYIGGNMNLTAPATGFGGYMGFNYSAGDTEFDFLNAYNGGGYNGFRFYQWNGTTYVQIAQMRKDGTFVPAGPVLLPADPTTALAAATKQYVDNSTLNQAEGDARYLQLTGGTLSGALTAPNLIIVPGATFPFQLTTVGGTTGTYALQFQGPNWALNYISATGEFDVVLNSNKIMAFLPSGITANYPITLASTSTFNGAITANGGISFGSLTDSGPDSGALHIQLFSTNYGIGITSARQNYFVAAGASHFFRVGGADVLQVGPSAVAITGTTTVSGAATFSSTMTVTGAATISGLATFNGVIRTGMNIGGAVQPPISGGYIAWNAINGNGDMSFINGYTAAGGFSWFQVTGASTWNQLANLAPSGAFILARGNGVVYNGITGGGNGIGFTWSSPNVSVWVDGSNQGALATQGQLPQPATVAPLIDSLAAVGTSTLYARQDHVHPTNLGLAQINVAGGVNVNLTVAQCNAYVLYLYGALTANIQVIFPVATTAVKIWQVMNVTSGGFTITLAGTSGGTVTLRQGGRQEVWTDTGGIYPASTDASTPAAADNTTTVPTTAWTRSTFLPLAGGALSGGINFGSVTDTAPDNAALHLYLFGNSYGIGITGSRQNYFVPSGASHFFRVNAADVLQVAAGAVTVTGNITGTASVGSQTSGTAFVNLLNNMGSGAYNNLTQSGDNGIIFSGAAINTGNLMIGPWNNTGALGIRIAAAAQTITLTGPTISLNAPQVTLQADPTVALGAATKQYVDNSTLNQAEGDARYLQLTGGTLSGGLTTNSAIRLYNATTTSPAFQIYTAGNGTDANYWDNYVQGTSIYFRAVNDANSAANAWMTVSRSGYTISGISLGGPTTVSGVITANGINFGAALDSSATSVASHITLYSPNWGIGVTSGQINIVASGALPAYFQSTGVTLPLTLAVSGVSTFNGQAIFAAANPAAVIQGAAGSWRTLCFATGAGGGGYRWQMQVNTTAEGGSNAGSDLVINRFSDTGASLGPNFTMTRSTGLLTLSAGLTVSAGLTTLLAGSSFGSTHDSANNSMALHVLLHTSGYGFGTTPNRLNYNAPNAAGHYFIVNSVDVMSITASAINALQPVTLSGGINFGSVADSGPDNAASHIYLYSTTNGIGITGNRQNYFAPTGNSHFFRIAGADVMQIAAGTVTVTGAMNASTTIRAGTGLCAGAYQTSTPQGAYFWWNRNSGDGATWIANQKGGGAGGVSFVEIDTSGNILSTYMQMRSTLITSYQPIALPANPTTALQAVPKQYVDALLGVSVMNYGAKGDGVTDDTAAFNSAIATGETVYIPKANYLIKGQINITTFGQIIYGDGKGASVILVNTTFTPMTATGVFVINCPTPYVPGPQLRDFSIMFTQPDTTVRANLTNYPPAIYAQNMARCVFRGLKINAPMICLDLRGNCGGCSVLDCELGGFTYNVAIDGSMDSITIQNTRFEPDAMTANQQQIFYTGPTTGIYTGRMDDLHVNGCLFMIAVGISCFYGSRTGATGDTIGNCTNCDFDTYMGLNASAGQINFSGCIFTLGVDTVSAQITGGDYSFSACHFFSAAQLTNAQIYLSPPSGTECNVTINGCRLDSAGDSTIVMAYTTNSTCLVTMTGNSIEMPQQNRTKAAIQINNGAMLSMSGNRFSQHTSFTGSALTVGWDGPHNIVGNCFGGWTINLAGQTVTMFASNN